MRGKELERQGLREGRVAAVGVRDYDWPRKAAAVYKVFAALPHSPPPLRRGQGWWFAVLRSSAAAIKMRRRLFLSPSACSTDLFLGGSLKINSYPAQQGDRVFRAQP